MPADSTIHTPSEGIDLESPELAAARTDVEVRVGREENAAGEVAVHHAVGTTGGVPVARAYFENGVDAVIYTHAGAGDSGIFARSSLTGTLSSPFIPISDCGIVRS